MPVVSTMGLGIDRSGRVERYVPPRVIEEGGGGGPPGPIEHLTDTSGILTTTITTQSGLVPLLLAAGTWVVWATGMVISGGVSLNLQILPGGLLNAFNVTNGIVGIPAEIVSPATDTTYSMSASSSGSHQVMLTLNAVRVR